jgi:Peptidase_C39 like family
MFVFLLVTLFCVALIITLTGLYLSPRSPMSTQRDVVYTRRSHTESNINQGKRVRNVRLHPTVDLPYRSAKQSYKSYSTKVLPATEWTNIKDIVDGWSDRTPHWLKLVFLSGTIFGLCLFLFVQMMNFKVLPAIAIANNNAIPQATAATTTKTTLYAENLGTSTASKSVVRIAQLDPSQYSSQDEYSTWAYSACSVASMTEVINSYGHNYRLTDILKVEAGLHEITPELGLLEAKGIDRTMAQFGFKMVPLENATLDGAIAVANQGHPVIVSFRSSDYWPSGHILVLRGGDAQNVDLADSSRLDLTVVSRTQFLQWWHGFIALAVPN